MQRLNVPGLVKGYTRIGVPVGLTAGELSQPWDSRAGVLGVVERIYRKDNLLRRGQHGAHVCPINGHPGHSPCLCSAKHEALSRSENKSSRPSCS